MKKTINFPNLSGFSLISLANIFATAILGIFWFYLASILSTELYGEITFYIAIGSLAFSISFLGGRHNIITFTAKEDSKQSTIYLLCLVGSLITATILYLFIQKSSISFFVIGSMVFGLAVSETLGSKQYKRYFWYVISQRFLLVGISIILYYIIGLEGIVYGYTLSFFPYSFVIFKAFRETKIDLSILKKRSGFILHTYVLDLSRSFSLFADKLIILPLFGFALLGNYQLGIQVIIVMSVLPQTVYDYILARDATGKYSKKIKFITIIASVIFSAIVIVSTPLVFPKFFPNYIESIEIIQIMSSSIIPITINYMFNSSFLGRNKSKPVLIGSIIFVSIQVLGIIILGNWIGILGAAWALLLGSSSQSLYYFTSRKK